MTTDKGVWNLQQVRDKQLQSLWSYSTTSNEAWTWGENDYGELGQNNRTQYSSPKQIPGTNWSRVGVRGNQVAGVKTDGTLWTWGRNDAGMLGHNDTVYKSSPVQVPGTTWSSDWGKITGTSYAMMGAVKTDGTMWVWGNNAKAQLGQNNNTQYSSPKQVPGTTWNIISSSYEGCYGIKTDGTLWSWGRNNNSTNSGVLGHNNRTQYSSPKQVGSDTTWATLSAAASYITATKTDGTLWTWGSNAYGGLGIDSSTTNAQYSSPVQVGTDTTWSGSYNKVVNNDSNSVAVIKTDGTLWTWGKNTGGQLGHNNKTQYSSPKQVGSDTTWDTVQTRHQWMIARKTDNTVWVWGENENGELGQNNKTKYSSPVQIPGFTAGEFTSVGVNKDGGSVLKML